MSRDEESDQSDQSDNSSISSRDSDRENVGDMSFLNDLKMIEKDTQSRVANESRDLVQSREKSLKLGCHVISSPGRERWNLERKDSIHSLASEPMSHSMSHPMSHSQPQPNQVAMSHTQTPFQRGALSVSSLNR